MPLWSLALLFGLIGGGLRVVVRGGFSWPAWRQEGGLWYDFGSFGTLIAGTAAGFMVFAMIPNIVCPSEQFGVRTAGLLVAAGIAGADILLNLVNNQYDTNVQEGSGSIAELQTQTIDRLTKSEAYLQTEVTNRDEKIGELENKLRDNGIPLE